MVIWNGRFPSSVGVGGVPKISSEAAMALLDADADVVVVVVAEAADEYLVTRDDGDGGGNDGDDNDCSRRDFVVTKADGANDLVDDTTDHDIDLFWFLVTNAVTWFVLRSVVENIIMKVMMNFVVDGAMVVELASLFRAQSLLLFLDSSSFNFPLFGFASDRSVLDKCEFQQQQQRKTNTRKFRSFLSVLG